MDNQNPKPFETTAFELLNLDVLHSYECSFGEVDVPTVKEVILKHVDVLLFEIENKMLVFMTYTKVAEKSLSFISHGQRVDVQIIDLQWSAEKKANHFMNHAIDQNDSILRVTDGLYFLPFESFYTIAKKDEKSKIYPLFRYQIHTISEKVYIVFKIMLYSQIYANLKIAMEEERVLKGSNLDQLIVPLFNYRTNFLSYEGLGDASELTDLSYFEQFAAQDAANGDIVKLKHLDGNQTLVAPAVNFNIISKLQFTTFVQEKIYLLLKLRKGIGSSEFMKKTGISFDVSTFKPYVLPTFPNQMLKFELQVRPEDMQLSDWIFICNKSDIEVGGKLAKDLSSTIRHSLKLENLKPPKAYTVSLKENQTIESSLLEGLQNKLTNEVSFVAVLVNKEKPSLAEIERYLIEHGKRYIIFELPSLVYQKSYFQTVIDSFFIGIARQYEAKLSCFKSKVLASFSHIKRNGESEYLFTTTLKIDNDKLDLTRSARLLNEPSVLTNTLKSEAHEDGLAFHFMCTETKNTIRTSGMGNEIFVLVSESNFSIFPNIAINSHYADTLLNFQNYRNVVSQERFFASKEIEKAYERSFVYSKLDEQNMLIMDYAQSFRLNFVDGLSELHLPAIKYLFLLIKSIRCDFAYFFKSDRN